MPSSCNSPLRFKREREGELTIKPANRYRSGDGSCTLGGGVADCEKWWQSPPACCILHTAAMHRNFDSLQTSPGKNKNCRRLICHSGAGTDQTLLEDTRRIAKTPASCQDGGCSRAFFRSCRLRALLLVVKIRDGVWWLAEPWNGNESRVYFHHHALSIEIRRGLVTSI